LDDTRRVKRERLVSYLIYSTGPFLDRSRAYKSIVGELHKSCGKYNNAVETFYAETVPNGNKTNDDQVNALKELVRKGHSSANRGWPAGGHPYSTSQQLKASNDSRLQQRQKNKSSSAKSEGSKKSSSSGKSDASSQSGHIEPIAPVNPVEGVDGLPHLAVWNVVRRSENGHRVVREQMAPANGPRAQLLGYGFDDRGRLEVVVGRANDLGDVRERAEERVRGRLGDFATENRFAALSDLEDDS